MRYFKYFMATTMLLSLASCGTIFTSSKQDITFTGEYGVRIYDKGKKIAEINDDGVGTAKVRKKLSSKTLIAKKEGYNDQPLQLEATFNPISVLNLLNIIAWGVDLGTGKCCKWADEIIEVQMTPKSIQTEQKPVEKD